MDVGLQASVWQAQAGWHPKPHSGAEVPRTDGRRGVRGGRQNSSEEHKLHAIMEREQPMRGCVQVPKVSGRIREQDQLGLLEGC